MKNIPYRFTCKYCGNILPKSEDGYNITCKQCGHVYDTEEAYNLIKACLKRFVLENNLQYEDIQQWLDEQYDL